MGAGEGQQVSRADYLGGYIGHMTVILRELEDVVEVSGRVAYFGLSFESIMPGRT